MRVGLTGGVASGKSTAAAMLRERGAVVVDADVLAREVVAPGTEGLRAVVAAFGTTVLAADGSLDRPALGRIVFADAERRRALEAIVHPRVRARAAEIAAAAPGGALVVHDIPLLVETGQAGDFDAVLVVDVPVETQLSRLTGLRGLDDADAQARVAAQASREERLAAATHVLDNTGSIEDLRRRVGQVVTELAWADGAAGWVTHERLFDHVFAPITAALLEDARLGPGQRVLDVGCGTGTVLAAAVAAGADAVGVDVSPGMVEAARRRVPTATVLRADAQEADLAELAPGRPFDRVVSRFGVMFFADPGVAFARLAAAAAPGARLAFACWRTREENPQLTLGLDALAARLDEPPPVPGPGEPGPASLADPDVVRRVLTGAGWTDVGVEPLDVTLDYGLDGSDGVEERVAIVLSLATGRAAQARLEPVLGPEGWAAVVDDVRREVRAAVVDGSVRVPGATWRVTATRA